MFGRDGHEGLPDGVLPRQRLLQADPALHGGDDVVLLPSTGRVLPHVVHCAVDTELKHVWVTRRVDALGRIREFHLADVAQRYVLVAGNGNRHSRLVERNGSGVELPL